MGIKRLEFKPGETFTLTGSVKTDGDGTADFRVHIDNQYTAGVSFGPNRYPPGAIGMLVKKGSITVKKLEVIEMKPFVGEVEPKMEKKK